MKLFRTGLMLAAVIAITQGVCVAGAEEPTTLTRAQWLKKIGASVSQTDVLRETLSRILPEERVEFTQRVLKAVKRLPVSPEEKAAAFVRTSVACIASAKGDVRYKVIAEVFACVPVEFLPVVTEELAKRFDQEYNKLTDENYELIASSAIKVAVARNAQTEEPSVRDTFVLLAFLRGAKNPKLQDALLALLPDDRMRGLASTWLAAAMKDRNYEGLLAAADVEPLVLSSESVLQQLGHASLDRLLADLSSGQLLTTVGSGYLDTLPSDTLNQPVDFGINRLPLPGPYPDQSCSIIREGSCNTIGVFWHSSR